MSVLDDIARNHPKSGLPEDPDLVRRTIDGLLDPPALLVREYFARFGGAMSSRRTGIELLDVFEGVENVVSNTEFVRTEFGFGPNHLVISSSYCGDSVYVYDSKTDRVYNVDFEGGHEQFLNGTLEPDAHSFDAFLRWYFEV
jgi:hypothetical protein